MLLTDDLLQLLDVDHQLPDGLGLEVVGLVHIVLWGLHHVLLGSSAVEGRLLLGGQPCALVVHSLILRGFCYSKVDFIHI